MRRRPTVVVVTEKRLFPVNEGNRARIVTLIKLLRRLDVSVVLVARRPERGLPMIQTRWLADHLVAVDAERFSRGSPSAYDCSAFAAAVRVAVDRFRPVAVIAEYIWMAPCLDVVGTRALRIVDTLDLMHPRRAFADRLTNIWVDCAEDEERALLEKADTVIAIQAREQRRFQELVPTRRVVCVPHHVPVREAGTTGTRHVVAIVGSDNPGISTG